MPSPSLNTQPTKQDQANRKAAFATVLSFINAYHPISEEAIKYVGQHIFECHLKKGELLQKSGSLCPHLYFVVKGILRGYIVDNRKKVTTWITSENELISSIRGFILQIHTPENIEALEDCYLLGIHNSDLEYLYEHHPEFNTVGRKVAEYYYSFAEDRAFIGRISNATTRYNYFMTNNGHLINRIPLMYIASYLGMSIETLSRIRSKLTKKTSPALKNQQ